MRSFVLLLLAFLQLIGLNAQQKRWLHANWYCAETGTQEKIKAQVPGTIHTDLLRAGKIPDPFFGTNEQKVQWVAERSWTYTMNFDLSKKELSKSSIHLVFEGLDTYAKVYLNNSLLIEVNNMFRTWHIPITGHVKNHNTLRIEFEPAEAKANEIAKRYYPLQRPSENNRNVVRKAQYHFGWDWAPHLVTCGIWRPVYLQFGEMDQVQPAQYAPVELVQRNDSIGQSFYFAVNGTPTYMRGANWVPADVFLPRVSRQHYRKLLFQAKSMGMNMLRVWGGGVYESDDFYALCDSLGIWVWQDFMFAGAMYPFADPQFKQNVMAEIRDNVLRLRKHPCIVLWCGNNEIDEAWNNWGWQKQFQLTVADSSFLWKEYIDLFHVAIPELLKQLDPHRAYITSSPLYGWGRKQSMTSGDSHYWGVWWGNMPKEIYQEKVPRFMSEFGMQAMPNIETLEHFGVGKTVSLTDDGLRAHQKHPTGYETILTYLKQNHYPTHFSNWDSMIQATQSMQADVLLEAIRAQAGSKGRCMGSLIWQLNDCWPVCSWSLIDYYGRPKAAVNRIKNEWTKPLPATR